MRLYQNNVKNVFFELFEAGTEQDVDQIIKRHPDIFSRVNWHPIGDNSSNFGVIENQQSNPIAALIEKVTNSIDAILMKKCYEKGINPKSKDAPRSMQDAIGLFFKDYSNWDLPKFRRLQSEEIQIIADGPPRNTSVIIYDNGEGQHPERFEDTFLSLLRGNKNEIHFVQGKYNMGGSGGITFCGKKSYQLIASKKHDGTGSFGYTLVREHPLSKLEEETKKNTWYEFLRIDGEIPSFDIDELDLSLHNRKFKTGSILKLYSYQFPTGYSGFAQDLNQSINEFLFDPALPILTVDTKERYPNNKVLDLDLYGLKRRLEQDGNDYVEDYFSRDLTEDEIGPTKVTCYVFKSKVKDWDVKTTKKNLRDRYFKNNMSVLFSINGQVHGHFTSEFITRGLKLNLLKHHLLIHVDCSKMKYYFRKELFMASRDRLKEGIETRKLRDFLRKKLSDKESRLVEIEKRRKDGFAMDSKDTQDLLKSFTKNLPMNSDLLKLLDQTFKLEQKKPKANSQNKTTKRSKKEQEPFKPQRYPSFFNLIAKNDGKREVATVPLNGERTLSFETDVENHYFDRVEDPGTMRIALLNLKKHNQNDGGDRQAGPSDVEEVFNVDKRSPKEGKIRVSLNPKNGESILVGDMYQLKVTLDGTGEDLDQIFWIKIGEANQPNEKKKKEEQIDEEKLGLPEFRLVYHEPVDGQQGWDAAEQLTSEPMDWDTVMLPVAKGDLLEILIINMDSHVLKNYKSKFRNISEEQLQVADRKYISSVYFHTLFLYTISQKQKYRMLQEVDGKDDEVDIATYLKDIFQSFYSEFILNFGGMEEVMQGIGD